jgi:hypothetical protein
MCIIKISDSITSRMTLTKRERAWNRKTKCIQIV